MVTVTVPTSVATGSTAADVLGELEALGSPQTAKTYRRHGSGDDVFGVSYADLGRIKKRIKVNHALARDLWASGNHDARNLATMIADPAETTVEEIDAWVRDVPGYPLTGAVADVAARMPDAAALGERWRAEDGEWVARAGWQVLAVLALRDTTLPAASFAALLPEVEARIHRSPNYVRAAMNDALIAIGSRSAALRQAATDTARRIGKVAVDHGDTACKTPDAAAYIEKVWARRTAPRGRK
jgi:3-methyladenine DNA glycosylase AlkD